MRRNITDIEAAAAMCALARSDAVVSPRLTTECTFEGRFRRNFVVSTNSDVMMMIPTSGAKQSQRKYTKKKKDPTRHTTVSFEEMKRLMHMHGPPKCMRNRASNKTSAPTAKPDSIRRKFQRWFRDFEDRFTKMPDGRYVPKFGHDEEMKYRADTRTKDKQLLKRVRCTKKRPPFN